MTTCRVALILFPWLQSRENEQMKLSHEADSVCLLPVAYYFLKPALVHLTLPLSMRLRLLSMWAGLGSWDGDEHVFVGP